MSLSAVSLSTPDVRLPWRHELLASLRENSPLLAFTVLFGLTPVFLAQALSIHPGPYGSLFLVYLGFLATVGVAIFAAFALWYLYHARVRKVPNFQAVAWQRIRNDFLHRDRLLLGLPILALWPITVSAFSYLKSVMPLVQPFYLDPLLYQWDQRLHFGVDPWRLLQPLIGHASTTYLINYVYAMWFFVFQAVLVLQACAAGNRKQRMQYLLTTALAWSLIGNLAATLMSSAGPCYYGAIVGGPDPYAPLMSYLHGIADNMSWTVFGHELRMPFTALVMQDLLWIGHENRDFGVAQGISASPSMHVASTWIIWRLAWSMGRTAKILGSIFLAFIFVGSIHLGWHYAIDGYLAIIGAWALWRLTGWLLDRPAVQSFLWPKRVGNAASEIG